MLRFALTLLLATACCAQQSSDLFTRAPKAVDDALRARIAQFYQDHVDGNFRHAEKLVAEDTKDYFYTANKPKYLGFDIKRIDYSDDFSKAKAMLTVKQIVLMPGFTGQPLDVPIPSTWKLVDGQWYWYVDQEALRKTPFGQLKAGKSGGEAGALPSVVIPGSVEASGIQTQVRADQSSVSLAGDSAAVVNLVNTAPGPVSVRVLGAAPGLDVSIGKSALKAGEKTVVSIRKGKATVAGGAIVLGVEPTNQTLKIRWSAAK